MLIVRKQSLTSSRNEGACARRQVFCQFGGDVLSRWGYEFAVEDLRNSLWRCDAVVYGGYAFDRARDENRSSEPYPRVADADKSIHTTRSFCKKKTHAVQRLTSRTIFVCSKTR